MSKTGWLYEQHACVRCALECVTYEFNPFRATIDGDLVTVYTCPKCGRIDTVRIPAEEKAQ